MLSWPRTRAPILTTGAVITALIVAVLLGGALGGKAQAQEPKLIAADGTTVALPIPEGSSLVG